MKKLLSIIVVLLAGALGARAQLPGVANSGVQIFMFSGPANPNTDTNFQAVANAGILSGVVQEIYWGQLDTSTVCPGACTYNFSALDSTLLGNYVTGTWAGTPIDLILSPALDVSQCTNGTCGNSTTQTPSYIYDGVTQQNCTCNPGYTGGLSTGYGCSPTQTVGWPVMMQSGAANAYAQMVAHLIAHLNSVLSSSYQVRLHVVGLAHGGENNPECAAAVESALGISQSQLLSQWQTYVSNMAATIAAAKPSVAYQVMFTLACLGNSGPPNSANNSCSMANGIASAAIANGIGLRITNAQYQDYIELEGGAPTAGNWITLFDTYKGALALDVQQSAESDPTAVYPTSQGTNCNAGSGSTAGSLTQLGPFISQHWTSTTPLRIWEVYSQDLKAVYSSSFSDTCWSGVVASWPYAPYDRMYRAFLNGQPAGTTIQTGVTKVRGTAAAQ